MKTEKAAAQASLWDPGVAKPPVASARLGAWEPEKWRVAPDWKELIDGFLTSASGLALAAFVRERIDSGAIIYPPQPFWALALTPLSEVRVVILGQDPYHGAGQAQGLAFSVPDGQKLPPSLRNIFKELAREYGRPPRPEGLLDHWAAQGVLLLNTSLTVEAGAAGSHARIGWQALTHAIFSQLVAGERPLVFMLWGAHAQGLRPPQAPARHLWLAANHPSPLSALRPPAPFIGCGHFRAADGFLQAAGGPPIDWLGASKA